MQRLKGRAAIVTGAGQGIGRGIARRFAREGANVLVAELVEETGRACAAELAAEFGSVDILVNNAWGGGTTARLEHKSEADLEHGWRVGLMSAFWAMQAAFPHMRAAGWGRIVSMCSLNGVNAHMYTVEYNAAKEGLRALTRTAAREWGRHGICANIVCPAAATLAYEAFRRASPENAAKLLEQNPIGRMGDPEADIAPVVAFLASDDARYVTGNTLFVDGGGHINGVSWAPNLPD
jgi:NAD(P)-dependent dehydrogenase (short-subunit alcohol dehydrogenase family)